MEKVGECGGSRWGGGREAEKQRRGAYQLKSLIRLVFWGRLELVTPKSLFYIEAKEWAFVHLL